MNLERTQRNLGRMRELNDPALEDVLNYIYDFCQDVKDDTGTAVDHLECRDEDGMYVARDNRGPACTGFCDGEYYQENGYDLTTLKDVLAPGAGPEKYSNSDFDEVFG